MKKYWYWLDIGYRILYDNIVCVDVRSLIPTSQYRSIIAMLGRWAEDIRIIVEHLPTSHSARLFFNLIGAGGAGGERGRRTRMT